MRECDGCICFPSLGVAARRLGLNAGELAESVLHSIDCGTIETEAVRMSIIDVLRRRGSYRGRLKHAVEDGTIFQLQEKMIMDGSGFSDHIPKAIWQGTFKLLGIELQCHVLDDGRRIIEASSMERLLEAMATGEHELDPIEFAAFSRWQRGEAMEGGRD